MPKPVRMVADAIDLAIKAEAERLVKSSGAWSFAEIASSIGMTRQGVTYRIQKMETRGEWSFGVPRLHRGEKVSPIDQTVLVAAEQLHREGMRTSYRNVALRSGLSIPAVSRRIKRLKEMRLWPHGRAKTGVAPKSWKLHPDAWGDATAFLPLLEQLIRPHVRRLPRHEDDIRSAAMIGLLEAVARFDETTCNHAAKVNRWIMVSVSQYLRRCGLKETTFSVIAKDKSFDVISWDIELEKTKRQ